MNDIQIKKSNCDLSAIILAGGKSRRMGEDKSDLLYLGKTLLNNQIDKMKSLGIEDIIVSGYKGSKCNEKIVLDEGLSIGPLSGLLTSLKNIKNEKAIVLSVDVPLVPIKCLQELIDCDSKYDKDGTITYHNGNDEPLIAIYNKRVIDTIYDVLSSVNHCVRAFVSKIDINKYESTFDDYYFSNINEKNDYYNLIKE